jgi:hypothetical protein
MKRRKFYRVDYKDIERLSISACEGYLEYLETEKVKLPKQITIILRHFLRVRLGKEKANFKQ